ncbi:MAG: helix-turn-helix domain-containing protein [Micrococcaceae bacterium]
MGKVKYENLTSYVKDIRKVLQEQEVNFIIAHRNETLVLVLNNFTGIDSLLERLRPIFNESPLVYAPVQKSLTFLEYAAHCAMAGMIAYKARLQKPQIINAQELIPERIILGDKEAKEYAISHWYTPLVELGDKIFNTIESFLEQGCSLESTARTLRVHPNTVRYRIKQLPKAINLNVTNPRDAYILKTSILAGKLAEAKEKQHQK